MGVIRLGYVHVRVTDLDEATRHYSQTMGMDVVAEDDGRTYLKSWDEFDHHSVVLEGGGVGLVKAGYKVTDEDALAEAETRLALFGTERLFQECLGFRASERLISDMASAELVGSWLFCGEQTHDIAIVKGPNGKLHHFAYAAEDWATLLRAGDVFAMHDVPIDYGPGRHGISRSTTIYVFDPAGNRNEVLTPGYRTGPDFPTITWTMDQAARGIFYTHREVKESFLSVVT